MKRMHAACSARMMGVGMAVVLGGDPSRGEDTREWPPGFPANVSIQVLDEEGAPLTNAPVRFVWRADQQEVVQSDGQGIAFSKGVSEHGDVGIASQPDGFYASEQTVWVNGYRENDLEYRQFLDFNDTITVKRIRQPARMYVKNVRTTIPAEGEPVGYDLQIGDWVAPFGIGLRGDILFTLRREVRSPKDYRAELSVSFPRPEDGIVLVPEGSRMSQLESDYEAPEDGYTSRWTIVSSRSPDEAAGGIPSISNAYFRVRTELDETGALRNAWYGKMYGAVRMGLPYLNQVDVLFNYYVNPDGSRRVEFDPSRNIFDAHESTSEVFRP